ncbi:hypothetical protein ACG7TL_001772 [Trametes sanguinea]
MRESPGRWEAVEVLSDEGDKRKSVEHGRKKRRGPVRIQQHRPAAKVVVDRPKRALPADEPAAAPSPRKKARAEALVFPAPVWRPASGEPAPSIRCAYCAAHPGGGRCVLREGFTKCAVRLDGVLAAKVIKSRGRASDMPGWVKEAWEDHKSVCKALHAAREGSIGESTASEGSRPPSTKALKTAAPARTPKATPSASGGSTKLSHVEPQISIPRVCVAVPAEPSSPSRPAASSLSRAMLPPSSPSPASVTLPTAPLPPSAPPRVASPPDAPRPPSVPPFAAEAPLAPPLFRTPAAAPAPAMPPPPPSTPQQLGLGGLVERETAWFHETFARHLVANFLRPQDTTPLDPRRTPAGNAYIQALESIRDALSGQVAALASTRDELRLLARNAPLSNAEIFGHPANRHLAKLELCPNAPEAVRKEALMQNAGLEAPSDNPDLAGSSQDNPIDLNEAGNEGVPKKRRLGGQSAIAGYMDRTMSQKEKETADIYLLRFLVHAGIAFRASEHPYLEAWAHVLRSTYNLPSRYVLTEKYLPGEEARVISEDIQRLKGMSLLTMMTDGWEDDLRRALYGTLLAELGLRPIVLGLEDISGQRATAEQLLEVVELALKKKGVSAKQLVCLVTDNPTTMRAFRHLFQAKYPWVLTTYCFLHALNTNVGRISSHPAAKETLSVNAKIVLFFNSSHYWKGQLDLIKRRLGIKRGLKTHTATRWYSLILQAVSVQEHRTALRELCVRDDAQQSTNGYSVIKADVVRAVLDATHWQRNAQLIRLCKPLVDAIGNLENRDASLADCMLKLIAAAQKMATMAIEPMDDLGLTHHAQRTVRRGFHKMNTDLHWFALFLHPLGRRLAVSSATNSRKVTDAFQIALDLAKSWNWSEESAKQLIADIQQYTNGEAPFSGGIADAKSWWSGPLINKKAHPIMAMALRIFSIVPHSAEIERLFSNLGGVQSVKRCRLSVPHMETLGILRNQYNDDLTGGATVRRQHAHMHTRNSKGLDLDKLTSLTTNWTLNTPSASENTDEDALQGPEGITSEDIDRAFAELDQI